MLVILASPVFRGTQVLSSQENRIDLSLHLILPGLLAEVQLKPSFSGLFLAVAYIRFRLAGLDHIIYANPFETIANVGVYISHILCLLLLQGTSCSVMRFC